MSLLDRVRACHGWRPEAYRPWIFDGVTLGQVRHDLAERLRGFPGVFRVDDAAVGLNAELTDCADRSTAVDGVVRALADAGEIGRYRGETYTVAPRWGDPAALTIDRGAVPDFGVRAYGVHLNGVVEGADGLEMWIGTRALDKPTDPGKLDHLVAGGQPHGIGVFDNLLKEAAEEADLPADLAGRAVPVGVITYRCERAEGLRDDVLFCYDLSLPADFVPRNTDGEIDSFALWPMAKVVARIAETEDFKFNVALVIVDFMVRRGLLRPDDPDYMAIVEGLHRSA